MARNPKCSTCRFRAFKHEVNGCDYILITGRSRGCSVKDCDKYEKGPNEKRQKPIYYGEKVRNC